MTLRLKQTTAWSGLCAGVLSIGAIVAMGVPPDADASTTTVQEYVRTHRESILVAMALFQVAIPFIFVFFAGLAKFLSNGEETASAIAWAGFGGAVGLQCVAVAGSIPLAAAAWRGASVETVRLVYDANLIAIYPLTAGLSIASILLPTIAGWMTGRLPRALGVIAAVLVLANLAELAGFLAFTDGPMALGVAPGSVAIPAWVLWVVVASLTLLVRKG